MAGLVPLLLELAVAHVGAHLRDLLLDERVASAARHAHVRGEAWVGLVVHGMLAVAVVKMIASEARRARRQQCLRSWQIGWALPLGVLDERVGVRPAIARRAAAEPLASWDELCDAVSVHPALIRRVPVGVERRGLTADLGGLCVLHVDHERPLVSLPARDHQLARAPMWSGRI